MAPGSHSWAGGPGGAGDPADARRALDEPVRIAVWSGPRNLSTAMMRAWENRADCVVVDEPLYASYLARTGIDHPGRVEVLAAQPTDPGAAVRALLAPLPDGVRVHYVKHMAHHLPDDLDLAWTSAFRNVLLIRDPTEVVAVLCPLPGGLRAHRHRCAPAGPAAPLLG